MSLQELLVLYENLACVEGRLNSHPRVITYANKALAIRKTAKAYFTKAKVMCTLYSRLGDRKGI